MTDDTKPVPPSPDAEAERDVLYREYIAARTEAEAVKAERDALRADAERWSALRALWVNNVVTLVPAFDEIPPAQTRFAIYLYKGKCFVGSTPTAAIDAARKA